MKAIIYMIICLSFCSELIHCSCLSYGHSCWGAHGKRSSNDRTEAEPQQQDRWALFKLIQDENNKIFGRDIGRLAVEDSMDYNDKRVSNSLLNALRKRNSPLVILNPVDDIALPQDLQKPYPASNTRRRRSFKNASNDGPNSQSTAAIPNDSSTSTEYNSAI